MVNYVTTAMLYGLSEIMLEKSPGLEGWILFWPSPGALSCLQHCSTWWNPVNHLGVVYWLKGRGGEIETLWNTSTYWKTVTLSHWLFMRVVLLHTAKASGCLGLYSFLMCKKSTFPEIRASAEGAAVEQPFQLASPCRQALTLYLPSFLDHYKVLFLINLATKHLEKIRLLLPIQNISDDCTIHNSSIKGWDFFLVL